MGDTFLESQITIIETQITAYNTAITFLITNPTQSYTLDTGQSTQSVTRQNLKDMQNTLDLLFSRRDALLARCQGKGTVIARPEW